MRFRYIKKVDGEVNNYDGSMIATGGITELNEHLSLKALKNPHYELIEDIEGEVVKPVKKKRVLSEEHKAKMKAGREKKRGNQG